MIKIGYFCSPGYTELGGMNAFLSKIRPIDEVNWVRCFPKGVKPNLKQGRTNTTPVTTKGDPDNVNGYTGDRLVDAMIEKLVQLRDYGYWDEEQFDYLLLLDDADCRFNGVATDDVQQYISQQVQAWQARVDEVFEGGRSVPLFVMFASPEVESWFVADWQNSFEFEYKAEVASALHHFLHTSILQGTAVESFGGEPSFTSGQASCPIKLSEMIISSFYQIPLFATSRFQSIFQAYPNNLTYSKKNQGAPMLSRIDPERVAHVCNRYFAPVYRQLKEL